MATPNGERNWPRTALAAAAALLILVASAAIIHRVLAPAEVISPARAGYPAPVTVPPGVIGTLNAAPLIVDGRLRVYATTRQVRADQPVDARTRRTPYWSYRRWPAEVAGLLADGGTVLTRWSDGTLVALEARTGLPRWRAGGPRPEHGYVGRRTGAVTVYAPSGLYTADTRDGTRVLVVTGATERRGIDLATGRELWRADVDPACRTAASAEGLTTTSGQFVVVQSCGAGTDAGSGPAGSPAIDFYDVATGAPAPRWQPAGPVAGPPPDGPAGDPPLDGPATGPPPDGPAGDPPLDGPATGSAPNGVAPAVEVVPLGCAAGRSRCPAIRTNSGGVTRGWLIDGPRPVAAPALDGPETVLIGDVAVAPQGTGLVARSARTGAGLWTWAGVGAARILAVQPGRVHLRTEAGELLTLDSATGRERSRFPFTYGRDSTTWSPGYAYAADGFVAVERLTEPVDPGADDGAYYLAAQPVILAAS